MNEKYFELCKTRLLYSIDLLVLLVLVETRESNEFIFSHKSKFS